MSSEQNASEYRRTGCETEKTGTKRGVQQNDEEWKRGEEVGGTTIVKWYWTNEAIKSLASERASEQVSKLAGRKSSWETGDAVRELWCNGVFAEKQTGSVGKTRSRY